ncbi:MAG TPA: sigma-70 family RNA polymerase sigma factor [Planctomycetota bacterium]|nr:sigma-70 family RNA polymerase sigma factor [Planctomycetota bacterium]
MLAPSTAPVCRQGLDLLEALVRRHQRHVWRYLRAVGADPALAEELAQDAFLLAWRKQVVDQGEGEVTAWLLRTARFLWLRRVRGNRRAAERTATEVLELLVAHGLPEASDRHLEALRACRGELAPRAAQALELFYGERMSREAVAAAMAMKPNGIKTLLQRTRELLRRCIEQRLA